MLARACFFLGDTPTGSARPLFRRRFQWQSYVPTLALLVTQDLGRTVTTVGWLYAAFVGTSIISSMTLAAHLRHFTPYTVRRRVRV